MSLPLRLVCFVLLAAIAPTQASTVLVLGDSLSAGYGLKEGESWVRLIAGRLETHQPPGRLVNASISGDTTAHGLTRIDQALASHRPDVVIIELGGNDGLQGKPLGAIEKNLSALVQRSQKAGAKVLLTGIRIPPNYGPRYTEGFHGLYAKLAQRYQAANVPFLLDGVGGKPELMQADGIHPNEKAQERIAENVWPHLEPLLGGH
ncbi:MAG: arylesterase [Gammaproteobacteria bacterium]|nr:arylesterase [Gammaproteobacteria bacterium]